MPTNNAWNSPTFSAFQAHNFTGISTWSGAGAYYSVAGTDFTVLRGGTGYVKTTPVTWAGGQSVLALAAGSTYYVYMNSSGVIGSTATRSLSLFENNIVLFEVLVDSATPTPNVIVVREDHPVAVQSDTSEWAHLALGPIIANINNGANIVLNGTTGIQINGSDLLLDHGLDTTIPDSGGAAVSWRRFYTNAAGKWVQYNNQAAFSAVYNNAGVVQALTGGRYGVFRLFTSKDDLNSSTPQYFAVINNAEYASLNLARTAITSGVSTATNELYNLELAQLGYVIFSGAAIVEVQISKATGRIAPVGGGATTSASLISTSVTNFNHILSPTDTNVQIALETLDEAEMAWTTVTGASQAAGFNWGYICDRGTLVTVTLPTTSLVGKRVAIVGKGAGLWRIAQNAGQTIFAGSATTTPGVGGYLEATARRDCIELICTTADTEWTMRHSVGNITVV
jgi:hypothetical protein